MAEQVILPGGKLFFDSANFVEECLCTEPCGGDAALIPGEYIEITENEDKNRIISVTSDIVHSPSNIDPLMDGEANPGISEHSFSREDHKHPTDTTRASLKDLTTLIEDLDDLKSNTIGSCTLETEALTLSCATNEIHDELNTLSRNTSKSFLDVKDVLDSHLGKIEDLQDEVGSCNLMTGNKTLKCAINEIHTNLIDEINVREYEDTVLHDRVDDEVDYRLLMDEALQSGIDTTNLNLTSHINNTSNPHSVTKTQVGLSNVDNTSDISKPISTVQQAALDLKASKTELTSAISSHNSSSFAHNALFNSKLSNTEAGTLIKNVTYSESDGVFTFTKFDNTTITIDTPLEEVVSSGYYDDTTQELVLVLASGQEIRIPASGLIDDYTGSTTASIQLTVSADNIISANIVSGGVSRLLLSTELQNSLTNLESYSHTHNNKAVIDGITSDKVSTWNSAADHISNTSNPHSVTKTQVGLSNVDNTADSEKSVSSATKLTTVRNIDGVSFDGSTNITHYGSCSTAAATAAKVVTLVGFVKATGASIKVKFTVTNTASSPTLNVNSTGASAIYYRGSAITAGYLAANRTYEFVYNGTQYDLIGDIDTNTTYSVATQSANGLMSSTDKTKLDGISTSATNTSVKGSAESTYRTGQVNLTPANIGAAPISHASAATTYGIGSSAQYGHNKIINNLNSNVYADGDALSAKQGYELDRKTLGGRNRFIIATATQGAYLNAQGVPTTEVNWFYSDYIAVVPGDKIRISGFTNLGNFPSSCYYDANKVFVSGVSNGNLSRSEYMTVPDGCYFLRVSGMRIDLSTYKVEFSWNKTDYTPSLEDTQLENDAKYAAKLTSVSDIQVVDALPTSPIADVMYLIVED